MIKYIYLFLLALAVIAFADDYRSFTDTQGRTISAKILKVDERAGKVTLEADNKKRATVPISIFSETDQEYINAWSPANQPEAATSNTLTARDHKMVRIHPEEYRGALRNPLKGFRPRMRDGSHEYGTLCRVYLKWNELERNAGDGIEQIMAVCNQEWRNVEKNNIKVIPRVYLHWSDDKKYWPSDMEEDDYRSAQFEERVVRLISRLGECWDNDPRVAWIQMGIIGKWGEHHSPDVPSKMQQLLGDAFTEAFSNKMITVRHPWEFDDYEFGIYWDSWAHIQQIETHGRGIEALGNRWHTRPIGGECAYDWGTVKVQPGENPDDTLRDPVHRSFLVNSIRRLHCNNLGWVAEYDRSDPQVRDGAEEVQKAFGYRFIITEFEYPSGVDPEGAFHVAFKVINTGSSPFYANWPLEISLLDPNSKAVVWRDTFRSVDIRQWRPGDEWNDGRQRYWQEPEIYDVGGQFQLPHQVNQGKYIIAIAILDPAGMLPSTRFAIQNYFRGGRHPIGFIGVGVPVNDPQLDPEIFDDPSTDRSLHYLLKSQADSPVSTH
jgi:hypothetical protein